MKILSSLFVLFALFSGVTPDSGATYTNPLLHGASDTADPWITQVNGSYYYVTSFCDQTSGKFCVKKSSTLTGLDAAPWINVWNAPGSGPNSQQTWAPELHYLNNHWYIYFTATSSDVTGHHLFVLQADSADPLGSYSPANTGAPSGQLVDSIGGYAIDPNVFTATDGVLYLLWTCGLPAENLCINKLTDPTHLSGSAVQISQPTQTWETRGGYAIQEGPVGFVRNGVNYIAYSSSGSYGVGLLSNAMPPIMSGNPLLYPGSWKKSGPIFDGHGAAYGTGSAEFVPTADGKATWVLYHGDNSLACRPNSCRSVRIQKIFWDSNSLPVLGYPFNPDASMLPPSGELGTTDEVGSDLNTAAANWGWGDAFGDIAEGDRVNGIMTPAAFTAISPTAIDSFAFGSTTHQAFAAINPHLQSYVITTDVKLVAIGSDADGPYQKYGVRAGYTDRNNYVEVWLDPKNAGVVATYLRINGAAGTDTAGVAGWANCPVPDNFVFTNSNRLQIFVNNGTYTIWLNGSPISGPCQSRTLTFPAGVHSLDAGQPSGHGSDGQVGVVTDNTKASYTNFTVTSPAPEDGRLYHFGQQASRLCLDNTNSPGVGPITQWYCSNATTQSWTLHAKGGGYYSLQSQRNGHCLAVPNASSGDGTLLTQTACSSSATQYWQLIPLGNGRYNLKNQAASATAGIPMMLDVPNASTANNTQLQIWHATPGPAQEWSLEMN